MQINPTEISDLIKKKIELSDDSLEVKTVGTVISVSDGIIRIDGLNNVSSGEMIRLPKNTIGLALNLERHFVGAVVLGDYEHIREGDKAYCTGETLQVPVGRALLGRVVNALGEPIDNKGLINSPIKSPVEKVAPGVIHRQSVSEPLKTGIKAIDSMVPIGRGQRELIIGDRKTGKTTIALDTIINQRNTGVKCIYVAIGQKTSSIVDFVKKLREYDALKYTTVVVSGPSDPASLQYLAPYSGCSMGEYFRDNGEDALIVYDDLTKQAWAYRQISLLLRCPPGREAYPGDVFYLHSRLLERASRVNSSYVEKLTKGKVKGKSGSLTALPIIETQSGDISAFIPTNVISITDGQIFLDTSLFNSGVRPAINVGNSVSRVGGSAQTKAVKSLGAGIRLSLAQYRELESFSQFGSNLDELTLSQLRRGRKAVELMKQKQFLPLSNANISLSLYALDNGFLDEVDINHIGNFEKSLHSFAELNFSSFMKEFNITCNYNIVISKKLGEILKEFKLSYVS